MKKQQTNRNDHDTNNKPSEHIYDKDDPRNTLTEADEQMHRTRVHEAYDHLMDDD